MKVKKTKRGFGIIEFKDANRQKCSLQVSSSACVNKIWLGLNNPDIQEFYPVPRDTAEAWFKITDLSPLKHRPQNDIYAFSRMELTQKQVARLLPHLQKFVETGDIH